MYDIYFKFNALMAFNDRAIQWNPSFRYYTTNFDDYVIR